MTDPQATPAPKTRPAILPLALVAGALGLVFCIGVFIFPAGADSAMRSDSLRRDMLSLGWLLGAGAIGAVAAVLLLRDGFGRAGRRGWLWAICAAVAASALGGVFAGTLVMPGYGSLLGAMTVFFAVLEHPTRLLVWGTGVAALHLTARRWRH